VPSPTTFVIAGGSALLAATAATIMLWRWESRIIFYL
jgi:hypothetical protein